MPKKGKAKNTLNKAKHTKLMNRKINKVKLEKQLHKERLKAIIKKVNEDKEPEENGTEEKRNKH
jgi:5,10-methylene-tetrahydrofolate dehydrogenase/methenyl tetrahydrofolate cyclohydrolase